MKAIIYTTKRISGIEDAMPKGITCDVKYEKNFPITKQVTWSRNHANIPKPEIILNWDTVPSVAGYDFSCIIVDKRKARIRRGLHGIASNKRGKLQVFYSSKKKALSTLKHELIHLKAYELGVEDRLHFLLKEGLTLDEIDDQLDPEPLDGLQPAVERKLEHFEAIQALLGDPIKMVSGYRSPEEQDKLYAKGRTARGSIVTNAKGGESMHQSGIALDYCFKKSPSFPKSGDERWNKANAVAKFLGFYSYGLNEGWDDGHIELLLGYTEKDFMQGKVDYSKFK